MRFEMYAQAAKWEARVDIASAVAYLTPDQSFGHLVLSHEMLCGVGGCLQVALDALVPVVDRLQNDDLPFSAVAIAARLVRFRRRRRPPWRS